MIKRFLRERNVTWESLWCEVWNLFKFGVVGGTSLGLNAGLYALQSRMFWTAGNRTLQAMIAVGLASFYNFSLHRSWTFKAKAFNSRMIGRYLVVMVGGTALHGGLFYIGHQLLGLYDLLVLVGAAFLVAIATYTSHRWYTFHPKHDMGAQPASS
ncbi:MAG TPA: GtrA family protein [Candidatus Methylomirabilis sp.]|nr:GtrA family protein [Candidatus Methylomirabilis sp.]